jgi:hypothetical protein
MGASTFFTKLRSIVPKRGLVLMCGGSSSRSSNKEQLTDALRQILTPLPSNLLVEKLPERCPKLHSKNTVLTCMTFWKFRHKSFHDGFSRSIFPRQFLDSTLNLKMHICIFEPHLLSLRSTSACLSSTKDLQYNNFSFICGIFFDADGGTIAHGISGSNLHVI